MIYAQLYQRDIKKKERLEKEKERIAIEKAIERNRIVAVQQQLNENKRKEEAALTEQEKQMLREEWQKEEERHKKVLQDYAQFKREIHEVATITYTRKFTPITRPSVKPN